MRIAGPFDSNLRPGFKTLAASPRRCEKSSGSSALGYERPDVNADDHKAAAAMRSPRFRPAARMRRPAAAAGRSASRTMPDKSAASPKARPEISKRLAAKTGARAIAAIVKALAVKGSRNSKATLQSPSGKDVANAANNMAAKRR